MPRSFLTEVRGFTPVIDALAAEVGLFTAAVYGVVWRYCQMRDGVCTASVDRITSHLGVSYRTTQRHLKTLCEAGYLEDTTPDRKNRPHVYRDTGRATIVGIVQAGVTETTPLPPPTATETTSDCDTNDRMGSNGMTESPSAPTESHTHPDRESYEESTGERERDNSKSPAAASSTSAQEKARELLVTSGVGPLQAERLAERHTSERIEEVVEHANTREDLKNPGGWIASSLDHGYYVPTREPATTTGGPDTFHITNCTYYKNPQLATCLSEDATRKAWPWCSDCHRGSERGTLQPSRDRTAQHPLRLLSHELSPQDYWTTVVDGIRTGTNNHKQQNVV